MSSFNGWVTAREITELPGFSCAASTILRKAKNEQWTCRKREGVKGIAYEFHIESLPHDMQSAIREKVYQAVLASKPNEHALCVVGARRTTADRQDIALLRQCPVILERKVEELTTKQKQIADARDKALADLDKRRLAAKVVPA